MNLYLKLFLPVEAVFDGQKLKDTSQEVIRTENGRNLNLFHSIWDLFLLISAASWASVKTEKRQFQLNCLSKQALMALDIKCQTSQGQKLSQPFVFFVWYLHIYIFKEMAFSSTVYCTTQTVYKIFCTLRLTEKED